MQQLYGGMEIFKTEVLQREQNNTSELLSAISMLSSDVRSLALNVDSMQIKLSKVDETITNLSKSVEVGPTESFVSTPTLTTTPRYTFNVTSPTGKFKPGMTDG